MQPLIWLGILALLLVVEAITAGLTTIWFAGGALVAAIACYAGANLTVQILLFLCVSLVLLIFTRPPSKETEETIRNSDHSPEHHLQRHPFQIRNGQGNHSASEWKKNLRIKLA